MYYALVKIYQDVVAIIAFIHASNPLFSARFSSFLALSRLQVQNILRLTENMMYLTDTDIKKRAASQM